VALAALVIVGLFVRTLVGVAKGELQRLSA
jgi:hypothetical protein